MKQWTPNSRYGGHAFGFTVDYNRNFDKFLAGRDNLLRRHHASWQIEVSVLHPTRASLPDSFLSALDECRTTDGIAASGHGLQQRRVVLQKARLNVGTVLPPR